mgnify:CR=1 FL=1
MNYRRRWDPVDELIKLGGVATLLQDALFNLYIFASGDVASVGFGTGEGGGHDPSTPYWFQGARALIRPSQWRKKTTKINEER